MYRNMIGTASALALLASLTGVPATGFADEDSSLCNVVLDGDNEPVLENDGDDVAHSNSTACADDQNASSTDVKNTDAGQQTGTIVETPIAAVDPLTIYFDVNQDRLDAGARAEVEAYASALKVTVPKSLNVIGHTDTSGSTALNERLSEARAGNVAAALIEAGLPADLIKYGASGEDDLALDTPDGTREASNRRVAVTPTF